MRLRRLVLACLVVAAVQACAGPERVKVSSGQWLTVGQVFRDCPACPEMVVVPSGSFVMGDGEHAAERPAHRVAIPQPFAMGRREVTQAEWAALMATRPSQAAGDDHPVENVDWNDAKEFVRRLSAMAGVDYRLPSEAEWEFAARAGTDTAFPSGPRPSRNDANYGVERICCMGLADGADRWEKTSPAGSLRPNAFGLHDMIGNVWEWTEDCAHPDYRGAPIDGTAWTAGGDCDFHVRRGGSWINDAMDLRSASRWTGTGFRHGSTGVRVVRSLAPAPPAPSAGN